MSVEFRSRTSSPRLSPLEQSAPYTGNAEVWSRERPSMAKPQPLIGQPINGTQHPAGQIDNSRNTKGAEPLALLVGP